MGTKRNLRGLKERKEQWQRKRRLITNSRQPQRGGLPQKVEPERMPQPPKGRPSTEGWTGEDALPSKGEALTKGLKEGASTSKIISKVHAGLNSIILPSDPSVALAWPLNEVRLPWTVIADPLMRAHNVILLISSKIIRAAQNLASSSDQPYLFLSKQTYSHKLVFSP